MSSSDFARSQKRLEDRGKDVLEKARQKIERERAVAARQAAREAAREEERRLRRVAQGAAEEQVRNTAHTLHIRLRLRCRDVLPALQQCPSLQLMQVALLQERLEHAAELEANNGVLYRAELVAVPAPQSIAADKGIKRAADKVCPHTATDSLCTHAHLALAHSSRRPGVLVCSHPFRRSCCHPRLVPA